MTYLQNQDPEVFAALKKEDERQEHSLEMIASENFVSRAVLEAYHSTLTNKYAEGYPGKRYYNGCENADVVEQLAIDRAKKCSVQSMQTYNHIVVHKQTWQFFGNTRTRRCFSWHEPSSWWTPNTW